jgi:MFS transporter, DHA3 family, macrolide efflux protein
MWLLLRDGRLRVIFISETINSFGTGLSAFALAWFLRKENPALAGGVLGAQGLGLFFGTVVLGAYLDRWDRRRTLVFANVIVSALVMGLACSLSMHWPSIVILVLAALVGFVSGVIQPALSASIPLLGGIEKTQQLNALFNSTWQISGLVTPVLAGVLSGVFGAVNVLYIDAATFAFAAVGYVSVRFPLPESTARIETVDSLTSFRSWFIDLRIGYAYFARKPILCGTMVGVTCVNAGFQAFFLFLPRVVDRLVVQVGWLNRFGADRGAVGFGFFDTVTVIFELLLSIYLTSHILGRTDRSASRLTLVGAIGPLVCMWIIVHTTSLPIALLAAATMGITISLVSNVWPALFARVVQPDLLGRVTSVRYAVGGVGRAVAPFVAGLLLARYDVFTTTSIVIATLITLSVIGHVFSARSFLSDSSAIAENPHQ